ncbi:MAG: sigma-54 dependent transcriptional regulator [Rhodocyclaceae bacterium]|nr:sigma-54 dependent transcriptional regulator [Rhodocyclaceae bacterium]
MTVANKPTLLIVDDDPLIVDSLGYLLEDEFSVVAAHDRASALAVLTAQDLAPDLALVDLGLPPTPHRPDEGFALIHELLARHPRLPIAVLSGQNDSQNARHALSLGATEFVAKPVAPDRLRALLHRLLATRSAPVRKDASLLIGDSIPMQRLRYQVQQYAEAPFPVLIEGESGAGKELIAEALHRASSRRTHPYLTLNCAAIAPTLIEAALFGHARGAFTGAANAQPGFFEEAGEGTLLLDEIGELPLELQPKLLRVLENGVYQRLGETQTRQTKARILAATNRDLKHEVRVGRFRADLYHRLSVLTITVPPLRERGHDRLLLLAHFRDELAQQLDLPPFTLASDAEQAWLAYLFPGNVRELRNIVIRLLTHYPGQRIDAAALLAEFDPLEKPAIPAEPPSTPAASPLSSPGDREALIAQAQAEILRQGETFQLSRALLAMEEAYIEAARRLAGGNLSKAARLLGMQRTTLYHRLESVNRSRSPASQS